MNYRILIYILILMLFISRLKENFSDIANKYYLKIYRSHHPWEKSLLKNKDYKAYVIHDTNKKNKITISSVIKSKILVNLDNKMELTKFLKNKLYYPETYIYSKNNTSIPTIKNDLWFIKPFQIYGGKGIKIVDSDISLKKNIVLNKKYIIQKNIGNLYLFDGKKGDIRVHYLVIYYKNELSFYLYKEGHIKLAKEKYIANSTDTLVQLTNVTQINKNEPPRCKKFNSDTPEYNVFFNNIKLVLTDLSKEIKKKSYHYKSKDALEFQLCGPDIIFDNNYNPYLFELNSNYPAYIMNKDIPEVKIIKKNISNILTNHLFINAINKKEL